MGKKGKWYTKTMIYLTMKCDKSKADEIRDFYKASVILDEHKPYEYFLVFHDGITIHAYFNKSGIYSIVFSGEDDEKTTAEAHQFADEFTVKKYEQTEPSIKHQDFEDIYNQIGSDEVGVGDFFGPLVVVATHTCEKDMDFIKKYRIDDSKRMKDDYIMEIGPIVKRRIQNYVILVSPSKLSDLAVQKFNIHRVMAKCHNLAHKGLMLKYELNEGTIVYVDQFTPMDTYKSLVSDDLIQNPLYFKTKGESYYPSVACASVIARYTFLKEWKKMEDALGMKIPKGANTLVDKTYALLLAKNEKSVVDSYVKRFFSNYKQENKI